jgi:hypothetical protein
VKIFKIAAACIVAAGVAASPAIAQTPGKTGSAGTVSAEHDNQSNWGWLGLLGLLGLAGFFRRPRHHHIEGDQRVRVYER